MNSYRRGTEKGTLTPDTHKGAPVAATEPRSFRPHPRFAVLIVTATVTKPRKPCSLCKLTSHSRRQCTAAVGVASTLHAETYRAECAPKAAGRNCFMKDVYYEGCSTRYLFDWLRVVERTGACLSRGQIEYRGQLRLPTVIHRRRRVPAERNDSKSGIDHTAPRAHSISMDDRSGSMSVQSSFVKWLMTLFRRRDIHTTARQVLTTFFAYNTVS